MIDYGHAGKTTPEAFAVLMAMAATAEQWSKMVAACFPASGVVSDVDRGRLIYRRNSILEATGHRTGLFKEPVERATVSRLGLVGDH
ncbi:MAG: hypothetical protein IPM75_17955 [Candidatus Competibacteraceae bacterium]|nr:hypothetical protein [Candidatus Competibacteraceae bacterium]